MANYSFWKAKIILIKDIFIFNYAHTCVCPSNTIMSLPEAARRSLVDEKCS